MKSSAHTRTPDSTSAGLAMTGNKARAVLMGAVGSLFIAILWTTLASLNPTTNYHLSPLISVVAAPLAARMANSRRMRWPTAIMTVSVGLTITVATAIIIHAAGWALGPSISSDVTPLVELIIVIAVGTLAGAVVALAPFSRLPVQDQ